MFEAFAKGLLVGLSLILAIGPQNAFVLRQGLRGEHVFLVCLLCALSDATLIAIGTTGFRRIIEHGTWIDPVVRVGGAAFLFWYGARNFYSAWRLHQHLVVEGFPPRGLYQTALTCLALTWLNPHVYVDTLMLIGAISTQFPGHVAAFASGAASASLIFFFGLGYAGALLRPLFARARSWQILEACMGAIMWSIAAELLLGK